MRATLAVFLLAGCSHPPALLDPCGCDAVSAPKVTIEFRAAQDQAAPGYSPLPNGPRGEEIFVSDETAIPVAEILDAVYTAGDFDKPGVQIRLTEFGASHMVQLSSAQMGKRVAILENGAVLAAPIVRSQVADVVLVPGLTQDQACAIVCALRARPAR